MEPRFQVRYQESPKILSTIIKLYQYDYTDVFLKFVIATLSAIILYFQLRAGVPSPLLFVLKYLLAVAVITTAAVFLSRTVFRKISDFSAEGHGNEQYQMRMSGRAKPMQAVLNFYEDHFDAVSEKRTQTVSYAAISKILESGAAIGIVYKKDITQVGGPKGMLGFPKETLVVGDTEELKRYILEKSPQLKGKIKKL